MTALGEIVRSRHDDILRSWTGEAQRAATARGLDSPAFLNLVAEYLSALADAGEELGHFSGSRRELVERHLSTRLRQGFELAEIIGELALLGRCIARMWLGRPAHERPNELEIERLFLELHRASVAVTDMFTRHMLEDEQAEKRYGRLLRTIAVEALQPGAPPFEQRIKEVLTLVMDAMGAQSAALLLADAAPGRKLELAAAVGAVDEKLEEHVASLDLSSFAGQVAAHERTTSILDAATTELAVSDALRRSGIHALIGIRLPSRHGLLGVLYLGMAEARAFSPREVRRLESLGEQLALHLDNAQLYRELREHVDALDGERRLRERFVAVLAHDLRGPLSAAKLNAELLGQDAEKRGEGRQLTTRIQKNIDRASGMIGDLLDANSVIAGKRLELRIGSCDLGAVAREVIEESSAAHGQRFLLEAEDGVVGQWSAQQLRRALTNLATNALKYGATGTPITITVRKTARGAEASVHNHGAPIAPEDQQRLFEPFVRTRAAETGGRRGWGLGLTLVHGCAEAHGGRVRIASAPESGTTFTLELPLDARPFQAPTSATDALDPGLAIVH